MKYDGKFGTEEEKQRDVLNNLLADSNAPKLDDVDESLQTPILVIDLEDVDHRTKERAKLIAERLADYYFEPKYIEQHPYIPNKISQEVDNIRRLLKMLAVNEKAQDTLIASITTNSGKGTLYGSLTSLQNSMLSMQQQLNQLTANLESIFREMNANCQETFEQKDKEVADDGTMIVRGSREFIKKINNMVSGEPDDGETDYTVNRSTVYEGMDGFAGDETA